MIFERERSPGYLTNWAARLFARVIDRRLRAIGAAAGQMPVFFALGDGKAMTQKALAELIVLEQPTMAATLMRMERDGLVQRRSHPTDGRSTLFSLTPAAMRKAGLVQAANESVTALALAGLGEPEREAFLAALRAVIASLEASLSDAAEPSGPG